MNHLSIQQRDTLKNSGLCNLKNRYHAARELYSDSTILVIARAMNMDNPNFIGYVASHPKVQGLLIRGDLGFFLSKNFKNYSRFYKRRYQVNLPLMILRSRAQTSPERKRLSQASLVFQVVSGEDTFFVLLLQMNFGVAWTET